MSLNIGFVGDAGVNAIGHCQKLTSVHRDTMIGEYIFGGNLNASRLNGANPGRPLLVVGAPTFASNYANLAYNNWFDTCNFEALNSTWIVCADCANPDFFIGNYDGTNGATNAGIYTSGGILVNTHATDNTVQQTTPVSIATPASDFRLLVMRTQGALNYISALSQYKSGALVSSNLKTNTGKTRALDLSRSIAIGSARGDSASFTGPVKIAAALMWNMTVDDTDLPVAITEITAALALRGIVT
jgi:hypothetical protein